MLKLIENRFSLNVYKYLHFLFINFLQASQRVTQNLQAVSSSETLTNFQKLSQVSKNMCDNGEIISINPLNL